MTKSHLPTYMILLAFVAAGSALIVGLTYYFHFPVGPTLDPERWGQFGDYFGGLLNPILAVCALAALLLTLRVQSDELDLTRQELRRSTRALKKQAKALELQNFEHTFFQLVSLHHELIRGMHIATRGSQKACEGRDCLEYFQRALDEQLHIAKRAYEQRFPPTDLAEPQSPEQTKIQMIAEIGYQTFYTAHQKELGHYLRTLYRIFKFVDESRVQDKKTYSGIMRAQLSSAEFFIVMMNGIHPIGGKFRSLIEKYGILENMPLRPDDEKYARCYRESALGEDLPPPR